MTVKFVFQFWSLNVALKCNMKIWSKYFHPIFYWFYNLVYLVVLGTSLSQKLGWIWQATMVWKRSIWWKIRICWSCNCYKTGTNLPMLRKVSRPSSIPIQNSIWWGSTMLRGKNLWPQLFGLLPKPRKPKNANCQDCWNMQLIRSTNCVDFVNNDF